MPLALCNGTHTYILNRVNTYIYICSEIQHTYKHSYMAAISAQIQCFYFMHTHTLTPADIVSGPLAPPSSEASRIATIFDEDMDHQHIHALH